jgi:hypothetical protein
MRDHLVRHRARFDLAGPADDAGHPKAASQFVFFSFQNGVMAASGHKNIFGPLSVLYMKKVLSTMPASSSALSTVPTLLS